MNKIQQQKQGKDQQALQKAIRTMPIPTRLAELIELVNFLPVEASGLREMSDDLHLRHPKLKHFEVSELFLAEFEAFVHKLPPKIKSFIGTPRDPGNPTYFNQAAVQRYNLLHESRDLLTLIASQNNRAIQELRAYSKRINEKNMEAVWYSQNLLNLVFSLRVTPMELIQNEQGELEWRPNILFESVQKARFLRIRQCLICGLFFWAGRIDQPACSKRCTQTLRVRRWRAKYQEKYKQQRIQKAEEQERLSLKAAKTASKRGKSIKRKGDT